MEEQEQRTSHTGEHGQDIFGLLQKIQEHLTFLEKKVDLLINQSKEEPPRERHFSRPRRDFGHAPRREGRDRYYQEEGPRRHFEKRPGQERPFDRPQESRQEEGQENSFRRRRGPRRGPNRGGFGEKKPFYLKRRERQ